MRLRLTLVMLAFVAVLVHMAVLSLFGTSEPEPTLLPTQTTSTSAMTMTVKLPFEHYLYRSGKLYGNRRAIIPLLLTSTTYHGTSLFATTVQGWILHLLIPQRTIDVVVFYDPSLVRASEICTVLKLRPSTLHTKPFDVSLLHDVHVDSSELAVLKSGFFLTPFHEKVAIRLHPVRLRFPPYIEQNRSLLQDPSWMRCGCPPICPQKRATVDYVQGTRWYTYDIFLEPLVLEYSFWIKMDVDIWMFRPIEFNIVDTMVSQGALFAHTGYIYNGEGCSRELHLDIDRYLRKNNITALSSNEKWWQQDDNVYYSNFVVSSVGFHTHPGPLQLAKYLNEVPTGFFKYRWTDQSLFHKVFGVSLGPHENMFLVDWSNLRCQKKVFRPNAVFYHSKQLKRRAMLRKCTII